VGDLDDILAQLEPTLGELREPPTPLEGGITNRNHRVRLGDGEYVLRRHGRDTELLGIDREDERRAAEAAAELGIAPAIVASFEGWLVTRYVPCSALSPEQVAARAEEVALALRRFHDCGVVLRGRFWVPDLLAGYADTMRARGVEPPEGYAEIVSAAERIAAALPLHAPRSCHNDLLAGNIIRAREDDRVMLVDWEYAGMGHPSFDLGNLAVNNGFDEDAERRLLTAYDGAPPGEGRRAELKLMRLMSDAREAAWGAVQGVLSELDFDFAGYARSHLERLLAAVRGPDFEAWLAAA
jgi:thiamine kinase-like enzyme